MQTETHLAVDGMDNVLACWPTAGRWNGFDNVAISPATRDHVIRLMVRCRGDQDEIRGWAMLTSTDGRVNIGGGLSCTNLLEAPQLGERVEFTQNLELFPHTVVLGGEFGHVQSIEEACIFIRLETHHAGLGEWNNIVQVHRDTLSGEENQRLIPRELQALREFHRYCSVTPPPAHVVRISSCCNAALRLLAGVEMRCQSCGNTVVEEPKP